MFFYEDLINLHLVRTELAFLVTGDGRARVCKIQIIPYFQQEKLLKIPHFYSLQTAELSPLRYTDVV